jgi:hypothetical protein
LNPCGSVADVGSQFACDCDGGIKQTAFGSEAPVTPATCVTKSMLHTLTPGPPGAVHSASVEQALPVVPSTGVLESSSCEPESIDEPLLDPPPPLLLDPLLLDPAPPSTPESKK